MTTLVAPASARDTGLPPGVKVGSPGRRVLAYVVDSVVPVAAGLLIGFGHGSGVVTALGLVVSLAWGLLCWRQLAIKAATPGMRLAKIQLVGFFDGRPVGWARVFLRWVVFTALSVTGIGLILIVVSILTSPRREGWHDRAVGAVVIVERPLAPPRTRTAAASSAVPADEGAPARTVEEDPAAAPARTVEPVLVPSVAPIPAPVAGEMALPPEPVLEPTPEPEPASAVAVEKAPEAAEAAEAPAVVQPTPPPTPTPEAEPAPEPPAAESPPTGHRTILEGWVAELDDGREIRIQGLVLLGRNPQPSAGEEDAQLVKVADESRTVSKTHLALGVDDAGLFVVDRGSTNGSTITPPGRPTVPAGPFHAMSVSEGSVVSIGDHWLRVTRESERPAD